MLENDIREVLFSEEQIRERIKALAGQISKEYEGVEGEIYCVGMLKGAAIFFADLVRAISLPVKFDFIIASSYGNCAESSGSVEIKKDFSYGVEGKHLILIEDIVDSGITMHYLLDYLRRKNPASLKLCALMDKASRRKEKVEIDYCGFEVPDEFLVGYGLDYAGRYRNLPYVGILKREIYETEDA